MPLLSHFVCAPIPRFVPVYANNHLSSSCDCDDGTDDGHQSATVDEEEVESAASGAQEEPGRRPGGRGVAPHV